VISVKVFEAFHTGLGDAEALDHYILWLDTATTGLASW